MDRATTHYEENLVERFQKYNADFILIPPGLTRYVQPLDVCVNAPFKKKLQHWNIDFAIDNKNEKKPKEDDIINAIYNIWYTECNFPKDVIAKSFKITGISSNLDGSEDNQIIHHHEICDEIISPTEININDNEFDEIIKKVENERKNIKNNVISDNKQPKISDFLNKKIDPMILDD